MAFFGCFGTDLCARRIFETRAQYLCAPILHYSLDGLVALCYGEKEFSHAYDTRESRFFIATESKEKAISISEGTVARLYRRYGKRLAEHMPWQTAFSVYDSKKGVLMLGGAQGAVCFTEYVRDVLFFSSDPTLLRDPTPSYFSVFSA